MAKQKPSPSEVVHHLHSGDKRSNIPTSALAGQGSIPKAAKKKYYYNPHLSPVLRFDPTGKTDRLAELIAKAGQGPLTADEQKTLAEALKNHQPWLEWTGKREAEEKGYFEVDPVALHIHERVSTQAILRAAKREDIQRDLFADPQEDWRETVKWYQHDIDWTNRLILGDSLQVMTSLATRENLAGQVQMIYMDPPYGIKFGSNFQPLIGKSVVDNNSGSLTREPEQVRAYRDTWALGTHSYIEYLRQRFQAASALLHETGSLFVQISDQNLHRVRIILDEVFGDLNFVNCITVKKTAAQTDQFLSTSCDYILWYAKDLEKVKFRRLLISKAAGTQQAEQYRWVLKETGAIGRISDNQNIGKDDRLCRPDNTTSSHEYSLGKEIIPFEGRSFTPGPRYWTTSPDGFNRYVPGPMGHL